MAKFKVAAPPPPSSVLENVGLLVQRIRELRTEQTRLTELLERCTADINKLVLEDIPEAMKTAQLTEMKLVGGAVLTVKNDVNVHISEANAPAAYMWLREHGHGGVIKKNVIVDVRALPGDTASALAAMLESHDIEYSTKESVHAATLKSLAKGLLEGGITLPSSISVHQYSKAELKEKKV